MEKAKRNISDDGFRIDPQVPEARELGVSRSASRVVPPAQPAKQSQMIRPAVRQASVCGDDPHTSVTPSGHAGRNASADAARVGVIPARKGAASPNSKFQILNSICNIAMVVVNVLVGVGLVFSAYAQRIPPDRWPFASVVTMTFPAWFIGSVLLFAIDLAWWRRTAWVPGLAMLACVSQIHDFCPLNLPRWGMSEAQRENSLTLMSYNVYAFNDYQERDLGYNRQLSYIMRQNPDVVCIQEAYYLNPTDKNQITQNQLDSLHTLYPYVMTQGQDFALLSKFPAQSINLDYPSKDFKSGEIAAWRLHVRGKVVNLFSVHLRSFALSGEDKGSYQDIVRVDSVTRQDLRNVKYAIVPKLKEAGIERAEQVRLLQKYLSRYGGKNAIVCGDFNDPVGCYGMYLLTSESHMKQSYPETAFGPTITYYANDLYFRIDHTLYRGQMQAWSTRRGRINASDHYPVITTFLMEL